MLSVLHANRFVVALKARQLGFTWLVLAYTLWKMVFEKATVLLFSQRDDDAQELMRRLVAMHERLPAWARQAIKTESKHELELANDAQALAFPTTKRSGRSYTASFVLIDEADFIDDLQSLLNAAKPTVDAGGKLVLLSTANKDKPQSPFKNIYRAAKAQENEYTPIFHGWHTRPGRTQEWYERQARSSMAETGSLDNLHQEYPATDTEALSARTLDKRIAPQWLEQCFREGKNVVLPLPHQPPPAIPGLVTYRWPRHGEEFVIGGDPAEGNPTSDDSALTVLDIHTGEEVATLAGRFEPTVFASYLDALGQWYNGASLMVERNNHGHAVLAWLRDHSRLARLCGHDGGVGWLSSSKGKSLLYDACADAFRQQDTLLHTFATWVQLASIEGATLRAPEGEKDDRADSYALALVAIARGAASNRRRFTARSFAQR